MTSPLRPFAPALRPLLLLGVLAAAACSDDPATPGGDPGANSAANNANNAPNNSVNNAPNNSVNNAINNAPNNGINNAPHNAVNNTPTNNATNNPTNNATNNPGCADDAAPRCDGAAAVIRCVDGQEVTAPCGDGARCEGAGVCVVEEPRCAPGAARCQGDGLREVCDASGAGWSAAPCPEGATCQGDGACEVIEGPLCTPGATACDADGQVVRCADDGASFIEPTPCEDPETRCAGGACVTPCEEAALGLGSERSNLGCEFWTLMLEGAPTAAPAVALLNPGEEAVRFTVLDSYREPEDVVPQAASGGVVVRTQVWDAAGAVAFEPAGVLEGVEIPPGGGALVLLRRKRPLGLDTDVRRGLTNAWQVVTTGPVAAFQYGGYCCEGGNNTDATLLLPVRPDDTRFIASGPANGYLTTLGLRENTQLLAELTRTDLRNPSLEATPAANGDLYLRLIDYDQLHLQPNRDNQADAVDLSGTRFTSDAPVALFAGHVEAKLPFGTATGDHVEHQVPPLGTWGRRAVIATPPPRAAAPDTSGERLYLKLTCGEEAAEVVMDPPLAEVATGGPTAASGVTDCRERVSGGVLRLEPRESCEVAIGGAVALESTAPFLAGTLTSSASTVGEPLLDELRGDPALILWPSVEQHREVARFLVPPSWERVDLLIVAPESAALELDGEPLLEPGEPVGASGFAAWTLPIGEGPHVLRAPGGARFGAAVLGVGRYAAWGFTAAMGL